MNPATALLKGAVITYQWILRPILGCNCRFYPSCSSFAVEALTEHGALRGSFLSAKRVLRCNPWHPGGYDPVPPSLDRPPLKRPPLKSLATRGQASPET